MGMAGCECGAHTRHPASDDRSRDGSWSDRVRGIREGAASVRSWWWRLETLGNAGPRDMTVQSTRYSTQHVQASPMGERPE